jgi:23S rRNA (uracil1939-C5)-methyltransferase
MNIKKGQQIEVDVTDVAFGGRGLARLNGLAVFVDQAIPGDRATIRIYKKKKNYRSAGGRAYRIFARQGFRSLSLQRFLRGMQVAVFELRSTA